MEMSLIAREFIVLAIAIVFWLVSVSEHSKVKSGDRDTLRIPPPMGILFGSSRVDGILNVRAVGVQIFWYIMTPIYTLYVINVIPLSIVAYSLIVPGVIIVLLLFFSWLQSTGQGK